MEFVSIIIGVLSLFLAFDGWKSKRTNESKTGSFFTYVLNRDKEAAKSCRRFSNCFFVIMVLIYFSGTYFWLADIFPDVWITQLLQPLLAIVFLSSVIVSSFLNHFVSFKDIRQFDQWRTDGVISKVLFSMGSILIIVMLLSYRIGSYCNWLQLGELGCFLLLLMIICSIGYVFSSFSYAYTNLRSLFNVKDLKIALRKERKVYCNIFNYEITKKSIRFVCEDEGNLKDVWVGLSCVQSIEGEIDKSDSLLKHLRERRVR